MKLQLYQVDAFASKPFQGNPAAVIPLEKWLSDEVLQSIAEENNLYETAFFIPTQKGFNLRWFTPVAEVNLCGHATLATAHVLFNILGYEKQTISFDSKSGALEVSKRGDLLTLNFPSQIPVECEIPKEIEESFNIKPIKCLRSEDYLVVFESEADILSIKPNQSFLEKLDLRGVIITAKSKEYDFDVPHEK